jgi:hypothetical protein
MDILVSILIMLEQLELILEILLNRGGFGAKARGRSGPLPKHFGTVTWAAGVTVHGHHKKLAERREQCLRTRSASRASAFCPAGASHGRPSDSTVTVSSEPESDSGWLLNHGC